MHGRVVREDDQGPRTRLDLDKVVVGVKPQLAANSRGIYHREASFYEGAKRLFWQRALCALGNDAVRAPLHAGSRLNKTVPCPPMPPPPPPRPPYRQGIDLRLAFLRQWNRIRQWTL